MVEKEKMETKPK